MSEIKNRDRILEAIDQLRRRKARPDAERICNFLLRRFGVDSQDTIADLERLVEEDIVIKVEYKGNISYRNAAKWSRFAMYNKNKEEGFTGSIYGSLNSEGTSSLLSSAVAELIIHEPDYLDFGVPGTELEKYMQEKDSVRFTKKYLDVILQRELNSGNIVKLENGNYSLADHPVPSNPNVINNADNNETVKMLKIDSPNSSQVSEEEQNQTSELNANVNVTSPKAEDVNNKNDDNMHDGKEETLETNVAASVSTEGYRDGAKRKRSKKVFFDPSDIHIPTRKRGRPVGATSKNKDKDAGKSNIAITKAETDKGFCYLCMNQGQDRRGQFEKLISCKDCTNKVHPSCIDSGKEGASSSHWQCVQCKTCAVCIETIDKGPLMVCCCCSESYHPSCHDPKLPDETRSSEFVCSRCIPPATRSYYGMDAQIDDRIPDVSGWSVEQVSKYLEEQGYPVQAAVFRDHDIDGPSLLLMKRSDVLIGLHLKLGPALKIYGQVKKLQIRQSDPALLWP
ncbi:Sterile alpha motif domain-containing protein 13 [Cryptotermes secundus]|uniref:Sterile alpha motif domain-containing protein 13 n=1 Tax=Cryptotermes secundus TaxID=105785 RepID=A0A2J7QCI4_9NEOP|nr:PHD finger protein 10 [Cryptotermes secundus]PNF26289.1 Sterile alpha motif domain-containing protein 13 [Cryptotermes secundus]